MSNAKLLLVKKREEVVIDSALSSNENICIFCGLSLYTKQFVKLFIFRNFVFIMHIFIAREKKSIFFLLSTSNYCTLHPFIDQSINEMFCFCIFLCLVRNFCTDLHKNSQQFIFSVRKNLTAISY